MNESITTAVTHELDVPGAVLRYDVRAGDPGSAPPLLLVGSPMAADGFGTLAGHFGDRTVVTYDPRGSGRSVRPDPATQTNPEEHAEDLHRVINAVVLAGYAGEDGRVDIFASSGGAVNALELVARHPEQVRTLVAHEPPVAQHLPDREAALAASRDVRETYQRVGSGPAMAKFITLTSHEGQVPADFPEWPVDPAAFGLPTEDDGSRDDSLAGQNIITCTHHEHDIEALGAASSRVVVAVGATSGGTLAHRAGVAMAELLGQEPVVFPDGHAGFLGDEYGMPGEPEAFAGKLREVLAGEA